LKDMGHNGTCAPGGKYMGDKIAGHIWGRNSVRERRELTHTGCNLLSKC
jgi:hypothetical protein